MSRCASCGASIEWVETVNGKKMPLDREERADGNILAVDGVAIVKPGRGNRMSHFATCPNARAHRSRR